MTFRVKFANIDDSNPDICLAESGFFNDMKKNIFVAVLTLVFIISNPHLNTVVRASNENSVAEQVEAKQIDKKAVVLASYLSQFNSPLQYHSQDFIDAANSYNLDWKLVPAIAGVESTFGKQIPGGYNGWGWGVYGTQAIFFNSWREAIFTVSKGLRENYLDKGLTDPYSINRIYAASPAWGSKVSYFMQDLDKFASQFESDNKETTSVSPDPKIAAVSASLVLR